MAKAKHRRGVRIVIGRDKQTLTDQEMREREIIRITREIVKLERERRKLTKRQKAIKKELRLLRKCQRHLIRPSLPAESFESSEGKK